MDAVIIASGPSLKKEDVNLCRGRGFSIVINESWRLAPWADVLYGCDWQWWAYRAPSFSEFPGSRITGTWSDAAESGTRSKYLKGIERVRLKICYELTEPPEPIGAGGNSAFQAAGLAVRWGFKRILLLGVDCHSPGQHWHVPHDYPHAITAHSGTVDRWKRAWENSAPQFREEGIEVVNCSPSSALNCFVKMSVAEALR